MGPWGRLWGHGVGYGAMGSVMGPTECSWGCMGSYGAVMGRCMGGYGALTGLYGRLWGRGVLMALYGAVMGRLWGRGALYGR